MAKSGSQRLKDHVARQGGRRATFVLNAKAALALEYLREERGFKSDTEAVNYALIRSAVEKLQLPAAVDQVERPANA